MTKGKLEEMKIKQKKFIAPFDFEKLLVKSGEKKQVRVNKFSGNKNKIEQHELAKALYGCFSNRNFNNALKENKDNWFGMAEFMEDYFSFSSWNYYGGKTFRVIGYNRIDLGNCFEYTVEIYDYTN